MRTRQASQQRGEGMLDVLAIIAAVAVVVVLLALLPALAKSRAMSSRINCINNMKQIGLSFRLWAGDNGDKYPMQVSTNAGGTMELVGSGAAYPHFMVMSNELTTPKLLICTEEAQRVYATNFGPTLSDANLSYFAVPEADLTIPEMLLTGDRNLEMNSAALKPGLFAFSSSRRLGWTTAIHNRNGNLCMADGSVQLVSDAELHQQLTNSLRAYFEATTNTSFRLAIP
jgi:prepilin-type processing-associated H-X9-DG protein